ncbi:VanZ family protein [Alkalicella caledoniensis]|uniref:VanZ family protein n=1 Tax=Alkalicella caledoniensis TaxID=2731377 RepID=A0A7G9W3N4_ALKCA|nr:VanZ family protein [Alkalicella caledoniensis]QNO13296.1 VanZ family protein [Alkalicella caledoniensis]
MGQYSKQIFSWTLVLLWMGLIFYMSAQPATQSQEMSKGVVEVVVQTVERVAPSLAEQLDIRYLHHIVRKNAHFIIYLILGVLVINALNVSVVEGWKGIVFALSICILYAISDEVHQLFVPGRSGEVRDVIIDSAGSSVGIGVYLGLTNVMEKVRARGENGGIF